jgi:gluconokinase
MVVILMGASGSGKTTMGRRLADALDWGFVDGDDLHPEANVEKMCRGEPLIDADRGPWLREIRAFIEERLAANEPTVVACSALKEACRDVLLDGLSEVHLVYLRAPNDLVRERMEPRINHFFDADLLDSPFDALEELGPETTLTVDADAPPARIVQTIRNELSSTPDPSEENIQS